MHWGAVIDIEHCGLESPYGHQNMCNLLISAKEVYVNVHDRLVSCESCFAGQENGVVL